MAAPQTQFEIDGGVTNLATEAAFLAQIATDTTATLTEAGRSNGNRVMHRLDLGNPEGSTWLIQTMVHADEHASREAVLAFVRDVAYSTDPDVLDYLAAHRIILVTPMNPDGLAAGIRNTVQGDINKDHLKFNTDPARVIQNLMHQVDPVLVLDAHERFGSKVVDLEYFGIGTLAVHEDLRGLADDAITAITGTVQALGYSTAPYPSPGRVSGRENAALHHAASVLLETFAYDPMAHRVAVYTPALEAMRVWHGQNASALAAAKTASKAAARNNKPAPYVLQTGDLAAGGAWPQINLPEHLTGYRVTGDMPTDLMDAYGVTADGDVVSMSQEARVVVPLLFDPESDDVATTATRIVDTPPLPPPLETPMTGIRVMVNGQVREVVRIQHMTGGQVRDITVP